MPVCLDNSKSEQNVPKFLAFNPRGEVPVLVDRNCSGDGATFCETLSILTYLDAAYPEPSLFGDTSTATLQIWQSIYECNSNLIDQVGDITRPLLRNKGANLLIR